MCVAHAHDSTVALWLNKFHKIKDPQNISAIQYYVYWPMHNFSNWLNCPHLGKSMEPCATQNASYAYILNKEAVYISCYPFQFAFGRLVWFWFVLLDRSTLFSPPSSPTKWVSLSSLLSAPTPHSSVSHTHTTLFLL